MAKQAPPVRFDWSGLLAGGVTEKQWRASKTQAAAAREIMDADAEAGRMDFMRLPSDRGRLKQSVDLARKMRSGVEDLIVCGIGGSALGLLALTNALLHPTHNMLPARMRKAPRVHVLDNADADSLAAVRHSVNLKKSLIVVISKSGGGGETIANFLVLFDRVVREHGGNMKKALRQVVAITDPEKGALRNFADEHGVASLPVPPNVGGRFSVLTPVGIFPAAVLGMDVGALMAGAGAMAKRLGERDPLCNPAMTLALLLDLHRTKGRSTTVFMPYANALWRTADWFRQLWAESLGKARDRGGRVVHAGLTPMAALGATDQHSQVQLFAEGPDDKTYLFLRAPARHKIAIPKARFEKEAYGFLGGHTMDDLLQLEGDATQAALAFFGRPVGRVTMPELSAHALGQILMFLEYATACVGALWNINTFDQPGVELGKILTKVGMGQEAAGDKIVDEKRGTRAKELLAPGRGAASKRLVF